MLEKLSPRPILEACVETLEQAILAEQCGANRIELCAHLEVGGLTPSEETILTAKEKLKIPIMVIIRPRTGGFVYDENEMQEMENAIQFCKQHGIDGVVVGCLTPSGQIDVDKTQRLVGLAMPMQVTFHKAVDETTDQLEALQVLMGIHGISRVLTSGGAETAWSGKAVLKKMVAMAADKITILVAGKVTFGNLDLVHSEIGAKEYHGRRIVF